MTTNELIIDDFYTELLNVYVRCVNDDWKYTHGKDQQFTLYQSGHHLFYFSKVTH